MSNLVANSTTNNNGSQPSVTTEIQGVQAVLVALAELPNTPFSVQADPPGWDSSPGTKDPWGKWNQWDKWSNK